MRTSAGLSLMLGDEQGSVSVTMPLSVDTATGVVLPATMADALAATRTAYTPYGELRGDDNLALSRGWLGQTEDRIEGTGASSTGTGLTYLTARYYDPVLSRFLSPDPLMDPGDPKTLDPYRYADNNPVVFTDANGLMSLCSGFLGRMAGGMLGSSCGSPDGATYTGAVASGVAEGGEQYKDDTLRVFTPAGAAQAAGDVGRYGAQAPTVWMAQSFVSTAENLSDASVSLVGAVQYDSPAMAHNSAQAATPIVLDGTRNYVSIMYAGFGVSFGAMGPASATRLPPMGLRKIVDDVPQVTKNRTAGKAAEADLLARNPGSRPKSFDTPLGRRDIDVFTPGRGAIESKVGRVSMSRFVYQQILKDAYLLKTGKITSATWVFHPSAVTGRVGPTPSVAARLRANKIGVR